MDKKIKTNEKTHNDSKIETSKTSGSRIYVQKRRTAGGSISKSFSSNTGKWILNDGTSRKQGTVHVSGGRPVGGPQSPKKVLDTVKK